MDEYCSHRQQQSPNVERFRDETAAAELARSEERFRLLVEALEDYALGITLDVTDRKGAEDEIYRLNQT